MILRLFILLAAAAPAQLVQVHVLPPHPAAGAPPAAISYVSSEDANATSLSMPTHQTDDLLLAFASREGNATPPSLPSGWTNISAGGDANTSSRLAYKVATSGSETSGTWTNAAALAIHVYRGAAAGDPIGADAASNDSGSSVDYPALTMEDSSGDSWVVLFCGHNWGSSVTPTTLLNAPSSYTNRTNSGNNGGTSHIVGGHDSNTGVSSYGGSNGTMTNGGWDDYMARSVEILD